MPNNTKYKKALIIDDDEKSAKLLKLLIEDIISVETAYNGKEGLEKIENDYFDVIISDVNMPFMNGIDLFYKAEKIDPKIKDRFIFYTASCQSHCISFFKNNGLSYLQKPSSAGEIMGMISRIVDFET